MTDLPTWEVLPRGRRLVWRLCWAGLCVEACSGSQALADLEALCRSRGIEPPAGSPSPPERGPSEVDEPGV